jgi:hypothetical protein
MSIRREDITVAVTADDVLGYLSDTDFPAGKDALVTTAQQAGAPEEVLRSIRAIPPVDYGNRDEVARSLRLDPGAGRPAGQAAEQARTDVAGVAEQLRDPQQDRVKGAQRREE